MGQIKSDTTSYEYHLNLGQELNLAYNFPESIRHIESAIRIAKKEHNLKNQINAEISLAELMRRTQNYTVGLEILYSQKNFEQFPLLHVRRLGRMTALYSEGAYFPDMFPSDVKLEDSIALFLDQAISISMNHSFEKEEASLRNELGLFLMRTDKRQESLTHLRRAAEIYKDLKDTVNYIRPMMRLMENRMIISNNMESFDSIATELVSLVDGKGWYSLEAELFKLVGSGHAFRGDSLEYYKWLYRAEKSAAEFNNLMHLEDIESIEVRFQTEKYKKEAAESRLTSSRKSKQLAKEEAERKKLNNILLLVCLALAVVAGILFRERRVKRKMNFVNSELQTANEKYELLLIESNHRIKNNLQMIISLIDYSKEEVGKNGEAALQRVSNKIETIGTLHKHLNEHVHFEKVKVDLFFDEIIQLYLNISSDELRVTRSLDSIEMKNERIIYLGLLLNELLSNTIEHNESEIKEVSIEVTTNGTRASFYYSDHGARKSTNVEGQGSVLIKKMIRRVGGKEYVFDHSTGTYQFKFDV
jgi:two-component sensor histidine kinase